MQPVLGGRIKPAVKRALLAILLAAGCQAPAPTGPAAPAATRGVPDWMPPNFVIDRRSATAPVFQEPEVVFTVRQGDCSSATDHRGTSDCATRTTRSVISTGKVWEQGVDWQLGHQYLYSFEFWVDPNLGYRGYRTRDAALTKGSSSRLSIARWEGAERPNNQLFDLKVDATRGVTFLGRTCVPPSEFGRWHRFNMRIRWANDDTGFLEVRCDGSLHTGPPIYARSGFPTNQALHCFRGNNCDPGVVRDPRRFNMQLGIVFDGDIVNGRRVFPRIGPEGLTVKMRRIIVRRLYVIFGRVENF